MIGRDAFRTGKEGNVGPISREKRSPGFKNKIVLGRWDYAGKKIKVRQSTIMDGLTHQHKVYGFYTPCTEETVQTFLSEIGLEFTGVKGESL